MATTITVVTSPTMVIQIDASETGAIANFEAFDVNYAPVIQAPHGGFKSPE
jgi:hypothetical protein